MNNNRNIEGALWALLSTALFAITAALVKIAVTDFHVLQILLFRQMVVFLSCLPTLKSQSFRVFHTHHPWIHSVRLIGAFTSLACGIWAVALLPLTTVSTLGFVQVFIVMLLAVLFLSERLTAAKVAAATGGFIGVLIVIRPGIESFLELNALIPLLGALGASVAVISVRKLSQTEKTATLLIYQALFIGLMAAIPMFWFWKTPTPYEAMLLCLIGLLATGGQWVGIKALRLGEASVISNINYTGLLFAAVLGYVLFQEIPDVYTLMGAAVIISASVFLLKRS